MLHEEGRGGAVGALIGLFLLVATSSHPLSFPHALYQLLASPRPSLPPSTPTLPLMKLPFEVLRTWMLPRRINRRYYQLKLYITFFTSPAESLAVEKE